MFATTRSGLQALGRRVGEVRLGVTAAGANKRTSPTLPEGISIQQQSRIRGFMSGCSVSRETLDQVLAIFWDFL